MDYTFEQTGTSVEQIKAYAALLSNVFPGTNKFTGEYLTWQYKNNPHGEVIGYDAFFKGELVAHYVTIPVLYQVNGNTTKGVLSLNTATHTEHQGKGLFTKLAKLTYALAKEKGHKFVIGVANQNSTPGFVKKLGFTLISPLEVKIGLGKITINRKENVLFSPIWDKTSMHWRLNNPSSSYQLAKNHILTKASKLGIYAQVIASLNDIPEELKPTNTIFNLWIGISKHQTKGIFLPLPDKLKASPLNLIYKNLEEDHYIPLKEHIRFELIDFDVY